MYNCAEPTIWPVLARRIMVPNTLSRDQNCPSSLRRWSRRQRRRNLVCDAERDVAAALSSMATGLRLPGEASAEPEVFVPRLPTPGVAPVPREARAPGAFPFPHAPYPIQLEFMTALYDTIDRRQIGIFESPTGTVRGAPANGLAANM